MNIEKKFFIILISLCSFSTYALTRKELFDRLLEKNLMLKEEQINLKAISSTSDTTWANPEIAISEMNSATPFVSNEMKMQRSIEVSQMFPNPQKVTANSDAKSKSIHLQKNQIDSTFKKIKIEALTIFLNIYQNKKEREIYLSQKKYLEKFFERLRSSQIQGQEDKIQIGEVENELTEVKLNITLNQSEYIRMKNMLCQMMDQDLSTEITDPELDDVILKKDVSLLTNSELKLIDAKIGLMEADEMMKKSEFYPEFNLKFKVNKSYSPLIDNSKEIMIGMTLPFLFWEQQHNGVLSTQYKIEAMKYAKLNQESELKVKAKNLKSEIEDNVASLKFLKESSLPIKERKLKLFSGYSYTDMKSLMNYKMSVDDTYMIKMKILEKEIELQKKYFEWTELEG